MSQFAKLLTCSILLTITIVIIIIIIFDVHIDWYELELVLCISFIWYFLLLCISFIWFFLLQFCQHEIKHSNPTQSNPIQKMLIMKTASIFSSTFFPKVSQQVTTDFLQQTISFTSNEQILHKVAKDYE